MPLQLQDHPKKDLVELLSRVVPNSDRLLVVPEEVEKVSKVGIARAQTAKGESETQIGLVVATGTGYVSEYGHAMPMRSEVGDRILLDRFAGVSLRLNREGKFLAQHVDITEDNIPVRVIRQEAVLATFPPDFPA